MRFALLTCDPLPEPDPDQAPLVDAFRLAGHDAVPAVWDDPTVDFGAFDALLLRSTWDYTLKHEAFRAWLDRPEVHDRLWNPPSVVRWNLHKGYLLELEAAGVPIVPTAIIMPRDEETVEAVAAARGWRDIIVKPAISAGSRRTQRFTGDRIADANAFVSRWTDGSDVMVQPYLSSVEGGGRGRAERAIIWIDGLVTHVVEKSRRLAGDAESVRPTGGPEPEEVSFALRVIEATGLEPLYARVDVMERDDGAMVLSELELIEPSLFFDLGPGSPAKFASACERRIANTKA